ncbi:MAG TPA: DUF4252 domain-containing protein [Salinimicrobium sp.]|nr:DUF4252 domain-containing protein [Salinimicrobium sp.]
MNSFNIIFSILILTLVSCNNETSLQEYYVENQQDNKFIALDVPASLLTADKSDLDSEQIATLETIKKVNFIAFPNSDENKATFEKEKSELMEILENDKFQTLMKYGGGTRRAEVYYLGEEDAIDEIIVFASDDDKGFGVARVLGDNMKPESLLKLLHSFKKGDLNVEGLQGLDGMFKD